MDTFMDKLAQRFTAQEMIKANATAETEEMNRLRAQVEEYTRCLNRMQQICAEMEQTAEMAKGKVDAAQFHADELKAQLLDIRQEMQNAGGREEVIQDSGLAEQLENMKAAQEAQMESLRSFLDSQMSGIRSMQAEQLDSVRDLQETQRDSVRGLQEAQRDSVKGLQEAQLDSVRSLQEAQFEQVRSSMEDQLDSVRSMIKAQISSLKSGQDGQLDSVRTELERQSANLDVQLAEMKTNMETQLNGANEFVHKECVKVYRNVQAVVSDENNKQSENMDFTLKPMTKKINKLFSVSVAALICSLIGIALQVLGILNII